MLPNNVADDPGQSSIYDVAIRLGILGLVTYFAVRLLEPFALLLIWAAVLAIALYPVYEWLEAMLGGRGKLSSSFITLLGLAVVFGPIMALGINLTESSQWLIQELRGGTLKLPEPPDMIRDLPVLGEKLYGSWDDSSNDFENFLRSHSSTLVSASASVFGKLLQIGGGILFFAASIIIAGFLFGPGPKIVKAGRRLGARVLGDRGAKFVDLTGATIRNVSRGVIGVAILQTILLGIGMILAGVPGAGLLCLAILLLCILQIGPALVVLPVIIWAWNDLSTGLALVFTIYMIPGMLLDNVLKPMIMSRGLDVPMLVILVGVIGGSISFGMIGLFVGPVVLSIFYDLVLVWMTPSRSSEE